MNQLQVFQFNQNQVRIVLKDGQPWWIAKDICEILEISNSRDALKRLDDDEKGVVLTDTLGGSQPMQAVNEPGLYTLVLGSRKQEAKAFRKWITSQVLPAIRQTGSYHSTVTPSQQLQAIFMLDGRQQEIESRMERLENNTTIDYGQQLALKKAGNVAIMILIGGKESPAYQNRSLRGKAFAAFWSNYKDYFNVNSINNTLVKDYGRGLDYVHRLTLPGELLREIDTANMQITM
ncbi:ORF6C domain-containing protein [Paenibacillus nuruki]|uniref:ORF6C domain-containing protein n=1 Tax=Paenibacillus nuruki TaxID=1886670 RepID=UPI002805EFFF|nr:BRO family protein [Paenibacillus nuruki]CAJ1315959.1 ORF6C domain-containing protein [Paenibacillus nuruki]